MLIDRMEVTDIKEVAEDIFELKVCGDLASRVKEPGQFVHVQAAHSIDTLLRRPISICDVNRESRELTMIFRAEGKGTKRLAECRQGEELNVLGPLGNGFPIESCKPGGTAVLVGGGVGVPPLYYLSRQLKKNGVNVIHVLGFANKQVSFYEKEFSELGPTRLATVDGSAGQKGFVTNVIEEHDITYDIMYACGPVPMLKALEANYSNKPLYLSLEQRMGCAIGACFACTCQTVDPNDEKGYRKVCSDGPVFKAGEVILSC
ncbi:dihydroorotate oxidase B electron transfer subunit [Scopulibacillus darangshiensis]|uniref:Dihydroorotate dehydrogenase B (NAD(+)), electron transfer subunit n=1 Tax=Scopulibacillus darangshiensis TaxID=442528 RepID=A0A4R2P4N0_9BACL|nr:dihydroorotate dehydrogenase electron transfer subunit [Scopulibacillus darangshiensis]TCP29118.1 dihydroorotate oxidase B electron transfer subunit [Scopulibacillus darangshiensis]